MASAGIFVIQPDGQLLELPESPYDSEALLQELLVRYPNLLAGDQFDAERPRRWLLVKREAGIPGAEGESGRWSVDHLFLDQDSIPTLIEVKRSTDTRLRREVVGQMLDYAANAVAYWPAEHLQAEFESAVVASGREPDAVMREFLNGDIEPEAFWTRAKTNLQAGRVRLVFVADQIPAELRRIVEFLNQQMDPAEVLAVEIKQYSGAGVRSLVPRVVGRTADAERRKGSAPATRHWDEESFLDILRQRPDPDEIRVAREILDWTTARGLRVWWGRGAKDGSFYPMFDQGDKAQYTIAVRTGYKSGYVQFQLAQMIEPFDAPEKRAELADRLHRATGLSISGDAKYPSIRLVDLAVDNRIRGFLDVLDWVLQASREAGT